MKKKCKQEVNICWKKGQQEEGIDGKDKRTSNKPWKKGSLVPKNENWLTIPLLFALPFFSLKKERQREVENRRETVFPSMKSLLGEPSLYFQPFYQIFLGYGPSIYISLGLNVKIIKAQKYKDNRRPIKDCSWISLPLLLSGSLGFWESGENKDWACLFPNTFPIQRPRRKDTKKRE